MFLDVLLPTAAAAVFIIYCLGRLTWSYSRGVYIVVDDKGLLPVRLLRDCHVVVYIMSRLPLTLLDRVPVVVAAAVVFRLHLEAGRHGDKDVDGGHGVNVVDDNKRTVEGNKDALDCNWN